MAEIVKQLVGHEETLGPLLKAQSEGKLASTLIFSGPPGIGKQKAAFALAQAMICERPNGKSACGECGSCRRVEAGQSESVLFVEPDGAQIKVEQAREILRFLTLRMLGRARLIIIDQAHLFNPQAGNSLLKSLEEPPEGTHFILISPVAAAILPTIRSRAQLVRFKPLSREQLSLLLGNVADDWILEAAQGSVQTAKSLLESREEIKELEIATDSYFSAAFERFPAEEISSLKELTKDRSLQSLFFARVQRVVRDALIASSGANDGRITPLGAAQRLRDCDPSVLDQLAMLSLSLEQDLARNVERGLVLENLAFELRKAVSAQ